MSTPTSPRSAVVPEAVSRRLLGRLGRLESRRREQQAELVRLRKDLEEAQRRCAEMDRRLAEREEHLERTILLQAFRAPEPRKSLWPFTLATR